MTTLTFQNTTLSVINQQNQTWLSALDIGKALDYSHPIQNVTKLFERHSDEFTPQMTMLIDMQTNGGMQKVRIFSLRGCHLIGMLSHTKVAKDFRKWVLDILDRETLEPKQIALPKPTHNITLTDHELNTWAWTWKTAYLGIEAIRTITPALEKIGSNFAPHFNSMGIEFNVTLREGAKLIERLTQDIEVGNWQDENWNRVLPDLRRFCKEIEGKPSMNRVKTVTRTRPPCLNF